MIRRFIKWSLVGLLVWFVASSIVVAHEATKYASNCKNGQHMSSRVEVITFSRSQYPHIVAHIKRSWRLGYPEILKINRVGARSRRSHLLYLWQKTHPQPVGDHKDLDEAPAAMLRSEVKADVMPVDEHENRSAGASLRDQTRDLCEQTRVRYSFTALSSMRVRGTS